MKHLTKLTILSAIFAIAVFSCKKDKDKDNNKPVATTFTVTVSGTYQYNGAAHEPSGASVEVKADNTVLTANTDYTLSYSANTAAGTATVTATGKGKYGSNSKGTGNFTIAKFPITVTANNASKSKWDDEPTLTYSTAPALFGADKLSGALTRDAGTEKGEYDIKQGTLSGGDNYQITAYTAGKFEIYLFKGDGSQQTPYEISKAGQLAEVALYVNQKFENYNVKYYILTADINLNVSPYKDGIGWSPIGIESSPFMGNFDGNGHLISGLKIDNSTYSRVGLFGLITGGAVKNLGVVNANIKGNQYVGGVAGYISNGSVTGCYTTGEVFGSGDVVGGVAGNVRGSNVSNCYSTSAVTSEHSYVGSIAGFVSDNGSVSNCYSTGVISGNDFVGGVAGIVDDGNLTNCVALNPSVTGVNYVERVAYEDGVLSQNLAYSGMKVNGAAVSSNNGASMHGADITAAAIKADGSFGGRFSTANGWTIENGKLPGLFGAAVEMPDHIQ